MPCAVLTRPWPSVLVYRAEKSRQAKRAFPFRRQPAAGLHKSEFFASAAGGPARTAVLRGQRSYADSGPTRTAVLRGQRQRDLSLWTPICRLRAGRGLDVLICFCCFIPHKRRQSETAVTANFYECKYIPWIKGNRPAAARAGPSAAGSGVRGYSRGAAQDKLRGKIAG